MTLEEMVQRDLEIRDSLRRILFGKEFVSSHPNQRENDCWVEDFLTMCLANSSGSPSPWNYDYNKRVHRIVVTRAWLSRGLQEIQQQFPETLKYFYRKRGETRGLDTWILIKPPAEVLSRGGNSERFREAFFRDIFRQSGD